MKGRSRWLLLQFVRREISNRFAGSVLGGLWAFVHPLALLVVYGLVFSAVFKVRMPPGEVNSYLTFVAVVLWPWLAFQEAVIRGMSAITANAALVKKVQFQNELLVHAAVGASFLVQMTGYVLVLVILALKGESLQWRGLPLVLVGLAILYLYATAIALALAAIHVFVRDVEQGMAHLLSLVFYLTPILYASSMVPGWLKSFMEYNPLAQLFELIRGALLAPESAVKAEFYVVASAGVLFLLLGRAIFARSSGHFEEAL